MKQIAVISDTHGLLRPETAARLDSADVIYHAGDLDTQALAGRCNPLARPISFGATTTKGGRGACRPVRRGAGMQQPAGIMGTGKRSFRGVLRPAPLRRKGK